MTKFLFATAAVSLFALPAQAQNPDEWRFQLTPYAWAAGLEGKVGLGGPNAVKLDQSFSDIFETIDFTLMGLFEARKGRWGVIVDAMFLKTSDGAAVPGPQFGDAKMKLTQQAYALAVAYRVAEGKAPVDLVGGARYFSMKTELDLSAGTLPAFSRSDTQDWITPFVGLRVQYLIDDRWSLLAYADVGSGQADLIWQALGGVHYHFSRDYSAVLGYRHMSVNYDHSDFLYDADVGGPYAGFSVRF